MFFQKNIDRVFKKLHEKSDYAKKDLYYVPNEEEGINASDLEKNDVLALLISAFITFIPAALIAMGILALFFFLFLI